MDDEKQRRRGGGRSVNSLGRPPTPRGRDQHIIIRNDDPSVTMSKGTLDLTPTEDSPGHLEHGHHGSGGEQPQPQDGATIQQQQQLQRDEEEDYMSPHHSMDAIEGQVQQQEHLSPVQKRALQHALSSPSSVPLKKHVNNDSSSSLPRPPPPRMFSSLAYSSPNTNSSNFSSPYEEDGQQKQLLIFSPPTPAQQQQSQQRHNHHLFPGRTLPPVCKPVSMQPVVPCLHALPMHLHEHPPVPQPQQLLQCTSLGW